ncbi:hypothetical protein LG634_36260 [Streptomyces bambusae]|uniref:hypothetical protein n=1 Tax=Streptomyces bambusae TaxID=1550616 RepID=UPI001CFFE39C|nr:hypothetical protein [Streptomyces bambusae]MCB5170240.1 hypothetical protein [Streptomyces bambusae]
MGPAAAPRKRSAKKPVPGRSAAALGPSRLAQVRLRSDEVQALQEVMRTLNLKSTSDALREGLRLLAREASEVGAAEEIRTFYGRQGAPLPDGVTEPGDDELAAADEMEW